MLKTSLFRSHRLLSSKVTKEFMYSTSDGANLCYEVHIPEHIIENIPPLLLLNGWTMGKGDWHQDFFTELPCEIIALDTRGVGESSVQGSPYSMDLLVQDTVSLIEKLGKGKVNLLGTSMGGMTALQTAICRPDLIQTLILCGTTPGGKKAVPAEKEFAKQFFRTFEVWNEGQTDENYLIATKFFNSIHNEAQVSKNEAIIRNYLNGKRWKTGIDGQLVALKKFDVYDQLSSVRAPVLIIHGKDDKVIPFENAQIMYESVPNSKLIQVETGHVWQLTNPEILINVKRFILDNTSKL